MNMVFKWGEKLYELDTTPSGSTFAEIYELLPRQANGIIADFLTEYTGQVQYTYDRAFLNEAELISLALELGHKFARSKAWKNLYDWAYFRTKYESSQTRR